MIFPARFFAASLDKPVYPTPQEYVAGGSKQQNIACFRHYFVYLLPHNGAGYCLLFVLGDFLFSQYRFPASLVVICRQLNFRGGIAIGFRTQ